MKLVKLAILAAVICIVFVLVGKVCDMITGGGHHEDAPALADGVDSSKYIYIEGTGNDAPSEFDKNDDDDDVSASDNVNYAALNAKSAQYMELIRKADMTFAQVDEIKKWVDKNEAYGNGIKDYDKIKTAIGEYVMCRDLLYKIKKGAGFEKIAKEFHSTVPKIKSNGDYYNLLVNLRVKMQKFTGSNRLNEEGIEEKLYSFAENHPNGINSFADLPK